MARTGEFTFALLYLGFNVIGGFAACWLGYAAGNAIV